MKYCQDCCHVMTFIYERNKLIHTCSICKKNKEIENEDRLLYSHSYNNVDHFNSFLQDVAHDPTYEKIKKDCECGQKKMVRVMIKNNIYYSCVCGKIYTTT